MLKKINVYLLFIFIAPLQGHIQFKNNMNEPLFVIDIQLKKGYSVNPLGETLLLTSAQSSHFLVYQGTENQPDLEDQAPLFSFGIPDHTQKYALIKLTTDELITNELPENLFHIPSSIKKNQAKSLLHKTVQGCSKCAERRKEKERLQNSRDNKK